MTDSFSIKTENRGACDSNIIQTLYFLASQNISTAKVEVSISTMAIPRSVAAPQNINPDKTLGESFYSIPPGDTSLQILCWLNYLDNLLKYPEKFLKKFCDF